MNNIEKIQEIRRVLSDHHHDYCPYCDKILTPFTDKKGIRKRYCDAHDGEYIIELTDYLDVIRSIVYHSDSMDNPVKYKKLSEF